MKPRFYLLTLLFAFAVLPASGQGQALTSQDEAAAAMLDGARRGYNEQKYDFAADRFRDFVKQFPNHKDIPSAQYGLGLCLLNGPNPDLNAALQTMQPMASRGDLPDSAMALYYCGVISRSLGEQAVADIDQKPEQAAALRTESARRYETANQNFTSASQVFGERARNSAPPAQQSLTDWALRSACDGVDMLLRLGRFRDAAERAAGIVAARMQQGPMADLAFYQLGYAKFMCGSNIEAGRALTRLAPFGQPFGNHARFILARIHHAAGERPEASALYQAIVTKDAEERKAAQEALKNPALRTEQRSALQAAVGAPVPDYVQRSLFHLAMLSAESGESADAARLFAAFIQQYPKSPLVPEAGLRLGYSQVLSGAPAEAIKSLQPFLDQPSLSDRAQWWTAKAMIASADQKDQQAFAQAVTKAVELMRRAADTAGQLARSEPDAKLRRGDILIEVGDALQSIGDSRAAVAAYEQAMRENNNPDRAEEALQRCATSLHLAGMYRESDEQCRRFEQTFPKSTLLPYVIFRSAENAYLSAVAATNQPAGPNRQKEEAQSLNEALRRYSRLLEKHPDFQYADLARHGVGSACYRLGNYDRAVEALSDIPASEHKGLLAAVPYMLADCLLRSGPAEQNHAVNAAAVLDNVCKAAELLESFMAASEKAQEAPDALLKLGYAHRRAADLIALQSERQKHLEAARKAYDTLAQRNPQHQSVPGALIQKALCTAELGDYDGAIRDLARFQTDPLVGTPMAPVAIANLGSLLRQRGKPAEAANVVQQCRNKHEGSLMADPSRKTLAFQLQYEHAMALRDWGKTQEARAMFESMASLFAGHPGVASAVWKAAQCRREELATLFEAFKRTSVRQGVKPDEVVAAAKSLQDARNALLDSVATVEDQAASAGRKGIASEALQSLLYEAAWCYRTLAEIAADEARRQMQDEARERIRARSAGRQDAGATEPRMPPAQTAPRWTDRAAEQQYRRLIAAAPASPLAARASLEIAEMLLARGDLDAAADALSSAMGHNPPGEVSERIRLLLAFALLGMKDAKGAMVQAQAAALKPVSPLTAVSAKAVLGETQCLTGNWADAVRTLLPFRDHAPWQNIAGVTDRALLRLGQAQIRTGQAEQGRTTLATLVQRFPSSQWVDEAVFENGSSLQAQGKHEQAVSAYRSLTARSASEWAARAQLHIGLCLSEQETRRADAIPAFLAVYYTYDEPELCARACWEAAALYSAQKKDDAAAGMLRKLASEFPSTIWAEQARRKLAVKP